MITRIFRVTINNEMRDEFERDFTTLSVEAVTSKPGFISCQIGSPTRWNPDEYAMITVWQDEASLIAFAGPDWNRAVIPPGMEVYCRSCDVDHFHTQEVIPGRTGDEP